MLREAIATGNTVEAAIEAAKIELGIEENLEISVEVEVLEIPTKKTLGLFGGNPAKVRVYFDDGKATPVTTEEKVKTPAAPANFNYGDNSPAERAASYLKEILAQMGLPNVEIGIEHNEAGAALMLTGGDVGFIIGHRGETLDSLQYLASLVANQVEEKYFRITLDVGNYREKRKDTLESLGKKMALKSIRTGRNNSLEPMNPYERRIIHTAVQDIEGAKSWSEGEDMHRHVVIGPEGGERRRSNYNNNRNRSGGGNRGGYNNNRGGNRGGYNKPRSEARPSEKPAEKRQDDPTAPVYGKIEVNKTDEN